MFAVEGQLKPQEKKYRTERTRLQTGVATVEHATEAIEHFAERWVVATHIQVTGDLGNMDVFEFLDIPEAERTHQTKRAEVLLRVERRPHCSTDKVSYIHNNRIESELDLVSLLHEMGHVRQASDPKTQTAVALEQETKHLSAGEPWQKIEPVIERIFAMYPHKRNLLVIDESTRSALEELKREEWKRFRQDEINRILQTEMDPVVVEALQTEFETLLEQPIRQERTMELRRELADFFQQVKAVLHVPENEMERDATRRAFRWMREIKERTGVDLFVPVKVKNSRLIAPKPEAGPDEEQTVTAIQNLAEALCTYTKRGKMEKLN